MDNFEVKVKYNIDLDETIDGWFGSMGSLPLSL